MNKEQRVKVKLFYGCDYEAVEEGINEWVDKNPDKKIWQICQSQDMGEDALCGGLTISIWYKENK